MPFGLTHYEYYAWSDLRAYLSRRDSWATNAAGMLWMQQQNCPWPASLQSYDLRQWCHNQRDSAIVINQWGMINVMLKRTRTMRWFDNPQSTKCDRVDVNLNYKNYVHVMMNIESWCKMKCMNLVLRLQGVALPTMSVMHIDDIRSKFTKDAKLKTVLAAGLAAGVCFFGDSWRTLTT